MTSAPAVRAEPRGLPTLLFGLEGPVDRGLYLRVGVVLMALKYGVEALAVFLATGRGLGPLQFVSPLFADREAALRGAPEWFGPAWFVWTLPFLWIAVVMSLRRADDAMRLPAVGLLVLLPYLNLATMLLLAAWPSRGGEAGSDGAAPRPAGGTAASPLHAALLGAAAGLVIGLAALGLSVALLGEYGTSLFFGTPLLIGVGSGFLFNQQTVRGLGATALAGLVACLIPALAMLLFALEGVICLVMALPIASPLAALGALVGRSLAMRGRATTQIASMLLALPLLMGAESLQTRDALREVVTAVEVEALPSLVWENVVAFPDLPPVEGLFFEAGVATPLRARIDGEGVGAIRHCEFTTGDFVEPITVWEPPHRLSFDVTEQPAPMSELSPYRQVFAPHLHGSLRSRRGEFRLIALEGGRTRLEGSTWYEFDMAPRAYWTLWSDFFIHRIHERVLEHVKELSERAG